MAAWSNILRSTGQKFLQLGVIVPKKSLQNGQIRNMSHGPRLFKIEPTRWQWHQTKDLLHFYCALGIIPLTIITFVVYVFIGPATLQEIPEGYTPKHWEYYRNPITRFFMRTFNQSHQQKYETTMHHFFEETQKAKVKRLERRVMDLMQERKDYQYLYYAEYDAEEIYEMKELHEYLDVPLKEIDAATIAKIKAEKAAKKSESS